MMKLTDLVVAIFLLNLINLNLNDLKFKHIILALLFSIFLCNLSNNINLSNNLLIFLIFKMCLIRNEKGYSPDVLHVSRQSYKKKANNIY